MAMETNSRVSRAISLLTIIVFLCPLAYCRVIYVDDDGPADFDNIQAGVDAAVDGDTILVAPGTYTGLGNRDINFRGKAITIRSTDPNDPAIIASTIIDCQGQGRGFTFESGEQVDSILEGITIIYGYAANSGGGILISNSSPTIIKSTILRNSTNSRGNGGGIYIYDGRPTISYCSIIENTAGSGGGLYIHESNPLISHCIITNNYALGSGGLRIVGMGWPDTYAIRLENCRISDNSANSLSGGIYAMLCTLQMSKCVVSGNRLLYGGVGGGLYIQLWTIAEINQCTIVGNKVVQNPPGVNCFGGGLFLRMCDVKIANSIIRLNRATKGAQFAIHAWDGQQWPEEPPMNEPTLVTLHHNDFNSEQDQEVYIYGEPNLLTLETYDNLDVDPCFADAGFWDPNGTPDNPNDDFWNEGDYHLKSQAGRWDPNSQSWVQDDVTSPCIDAGDPNSPIGSEPFPNGGIINMGAYGGTAEASKSLSGTSIYIFGPEQSMVIQTGGIAGVNRAYILTGQFQLTIDFGAGKARFSNVEAIATDYSEPVRKLDPNDVFNLTGLTGTISKDGSIQFTGRTVDESNVLLYLTLSDELISLKGQTTPPPNSADFFIFDLDAVAQRKYGGGTGELNDPHLIYTSDQLNAIGAEPNDWNKHFKLMADIDLSGYSYDKAVIAPDLDPCDLSFIGTSFTGVFDGNGHTISNLTITGKYYLGLIGQLETGAKIENLGLTDVNIAGSEYIGGFVGYSKGNISTCYCTGTVTGNKRIGGLAGRNWRNITACYSTSTITGKNSAGGIAAENYGSITNCYSTGTVTGNWDVGGLVGVNYSSIANSYSTVTVSGETRAGGLVGYNYQDSIVTSSFWDVETSGQSISDGGTAMSTAELQTAGTFLDAGWDFVEEIENGTEDIWKMWDGYDYPRLIWESGPNPPLVFVDINDPNFYGQMSRYEVTNAQYCDFLNAALASGDITIGSARNPRWHGYYAIGASGSNPGIDYAGVMYYNGDGSGWSGLDGETNGGAARIFYGEGAFYVDSGFGNHPVTEVSWHGAMAFANYYGYYLPTEEQWQGVADYDGTYLYGCGTSIDNSKANTRGSAHPFGTTAVGSFGQYGYDMSDMAGNVWEWTSTSSGSFRVLRGGCWFFKGDRCTVSFTQTCGPGWTDGSIGFRVCR